MILKRLTLNNIRAYRGSATISFAQPGSQDTTIVHGVNGAGKTSLFEALNWVLYGDKIKYPGHLLNESVLASVADGDTVTGSVSLDFEDEKQSFFLSRGIVGTLTNGIVSEKQSAVELYTIDAMGNSKLVKGADQRILGMLPSAIRTFFLFDGDKIAEFTKPGKEQDRQITKAVNDVLRLELLNRASQHLSQLSRQLNKSIAEKGSAKAKDLQASFERQAALRDQLIDRRQLLNLELESAKDRETDVDRQYREIEHVARQALKRTALESDLKSLKVRLTDVKTNLMQTNVAAFVLPMSHVLDEAEDLLEQKRKKREIPSDYKDQFLRDLLSHNRCICDRELVPGAVSFLKVEGLLQQIVPDSLQEFAMVLNGEVKHLLRSENALKAKILGYLAEIDQIHKNLDVLQKELDELNASLGSEQGADVAALEEQRRIIRDEIGKYQTELGGLGIEIESARRAVERLEKEFHAESERQEGLRVLTAEADAASRAANEIARIRDQLIQELKEELSAEATRIFKTFTWKTEFFERVDIGEDYIIKLFDSNGRDMRGVMSMGETQLLSLAFILAMTRISDHQAPLVIDTPLARLDRTVRLKLVRALPELTTQLVLLVTDSEMNAEVRGEIASRIGAEYFLDFHDGVSKINEGRL